MDEKTIRAFLAIDPPEEILKEVGAVQNRLKNLIRGEIRWVRPEGIHLTLKFFGDIAENAIADISVAVEKAAAGARPFSLAIGGTGVFPDTHRPRVLWLGMDGDVARLLTFQEELERELRMIGFPGEERPFLPHLTLGRIKAPKGLLGLAKALESGERCTAGRFLATGLSLFKSELTPRGAVYTKLKWFPFA